MKTFDFKALNAKLTKYMSPQAMMDMNKFLENMPVRAGYAVLIAGGFTWFLGGLALVYATTVAQNVADIRAELVKSEALKPVVAQLRQTPVAEADIRAFTKLVDPRYNDVSITAPGGGKITVVSGDGRYFGAFREAINHAYNGGQRWRLSLDTMCVGRDCDGPFLSGTFNVNTLSVER